MYSLTDYARYEAISSLPLSGDMLPSALMSKMLALLPADHQACFFLHGAFLKRLQPDVRAHLVHDRTSDSLSLALRANQIYQSQVSSTSAVNHVSSTPDDCPILAMLLLLPVSVPSAHLLQVPAPADLSLLLQPPAILIYLLSAGITGIMLIRPRSVTLSVPGWETSCLPYLRVL